MNILIDKEATLNVIRSFISSLRPEATGLITDIYDAVLHMPSAQPKATDLISRQSAIVQTSKVIHDDAVAHDVKEVLKALPSAQPQTGRWKNVGMYTVECSKCKAQLHELECPNFCPNCGAKMEGDDT